MHSINYRQGNATQPVNRPGIIAHVCNDAGGWGKGFVMAISARWDAPEFAYRKWHRQGTKPNSPTPFRLGLNQLVQVEPDLHVMNMVAQHLYYDAITNPVPLRYDALEECLQALFITAAERNLSVHLPTIGGGLARGDWKRIEALIQKHMGNVPVTVYQLR